MLKSWYMKCSEGERIARGLLPQVASHTITLRMQLWLSMPHREGLMRARGRSPAYSVSASMVQSNI